MSDPVCNYMADGPVATCRRLIDCMPHEFKYGGSMYRKLLIMNGLRKHPLLSGLSEKLLQVCQLPSSPSVRSSSAIAA